jgi:hypothetical protein
MKQRYHGKHLLQHSKSTSKTARFPIDVVVGPEFVTGRWKQEQPENGAQYDFDSHHDSIG